MATSALPHTLILVALLAAGPAARAADPKPGDGRIYSCVDGSGRRLSSDRPIPECVAQEQRMLGRDGSQRGVLPPLSSREEQARQDALRVQQSQQQANQNDAVRRDRMLLTRYPDPPSHDLARQRALAPVLQLIEQAKNRLHALEADADALATERAALGNKPVSDDLRSRTNINDGATEAQRNILLNQEAERERLQQQFEIERARLQQLWAGVAPGSPDIKRN